MRVQNNSIYNYIVISIAFLSGIAIPISTALQNITIALIVVISLVDKDMRSKFTEVLKNKLVLSSIALYIVVLLWVFKSNAPHKDIVHMVIKMRTFILLPFMFLFFNNQSNRVSACYGFALGAIITVLMSMFFFVTKMHFLNSGITPWSGPFGDWAVFRYHTDHNYFIGVMALVIISLLLYIKNIPSKIKFLLYIILILSLIDVFYLVQGRAGQILVILMAIGLFILYDWRKGIKATLIIILATLAIIYTSPAIRSGIYRTEVDVVQYDDGNARTSVGARIQFHKYALDMIKIHPIIGYGTGSFHYEYGKYTKFPAQDVTRHPHNDFYWLWVENGILGPLLLCIITLLACFYGYKQKNPEGNLAILVALSYAGGAMQGGFFTDNIGGASFIIIIAILLSGSTFGNLIKKR